MGREAVSDGRAIGEEEKMVRGLFGGILAVVGALVLAAGALTVVGQSPALARDGGPPTTVLKKGQRTLQKGNQGSYCWSSGPDSGMCVDAVSDYPVADRVEEGSKLYIRISKAQRPRSFDLAAYRKVDRNEYPVGRPQDVPFSWRPVMRDGERIAWDAVFELDQPDRHYYLDAFGIWKEGDSSWSFHAKTRN